MADLNAAIDSLGRAALRLKANHERLLTAAKELLDVLEDYLGGEDPPPPEVLNTLRDAIAECEAEQKG